MFEIVDYQFICKKCVSLLLGCTCCMGAISVVRCVFVLLVRIVEANQ